MHNKYYNILDELTFNISRARSSTNSSHCSTSSSLAACFALLEFSGSCQLLCFAPFVDFFIFLNDDILIISKVLSNTDKISHWIFMARCVCVCLGMKCATVWCEVQVANMGMCVCVGAKGKLYVVSGSCCVGIDW